MNLKAKNIKVSSGGPLVAVLHYNTAKKLNLYPNDRILIKRARKKTEINCVVDLTTTGLKNDEIGMFEELFHKVGVDQGTHIEVKRAERPNSINYIKDKLDGYELTKNQIHELVKDINDNEFSDAELTYFVSGCYSQGLSLQETFHLTNAIVENGDKLKFNKKIILDKHCIGGVPGNRTTMVVVPILASLGFTLPKTSSRAITSASGTADTMEVLAPVKLSMTKIKQVIAKTNACIVWGGAVNLASADDKLIKIRHPLSIDPTGMLLASILAKKKAAGATHVLIDIPVGKGAKIEDKKEANDLKKAFQKIGKLLKMKIKVIITDGSSPIGNGIGPSLESSDVISVLKGDGPNDFREKCILMATEMLKLAKVPNAHKKVIEAIETRKAYEKFKEIIKAQGGKKYFSVPKAKYYFNVKATKNGKVKEMKNKEISQLARLAGSPDDKTAGLYIRVDIGEKVKKDMVLYTIYSSNKQDIDTVKKRLKAMSPIIY